MGSGGRAHVCDEALLLLPQRTQKGEAGREGPWSHLRVLLGEEVDEAEPSVRAHPRHLLRQADCLQLPEGAGNKNTGVSESRPAKGAGGGRTDSHPLTLSS